MNDEVFIIYTERGFKRTTKTPPNLGAGEYCTRLVLKVPDRFFRNPIPTATLEVPETAVGGPVPDIDLTSMEEICTVQEGVAGRDEDGEHCFICPSCGFEYWRKDIGTHYKPQPEEPPRDPGAGTVGPL